MSTQTKAFLYLAVTLPIMALALFVPAGAIDWFAEWVYFTILVAFSIATTLWLLKNSPGLLEERIGVKSFQKKWDKIFVLVFYAIFLGWLVLMPLDALRFHWSRMPAWLQAIGALLAVFSLYISFLTFRENPYAAAAVRIQKNRGQKVVSTVPYSRVRHPMYAAAFLYCLGTPLLLGSWYGLLFEPLFVGGSTVKGNYGGTYVARTTRRL